MKFQICTCGAHPFIHGHFYDENGPYIKEVGGLVHLSGDLFSQADVRAFIQKSVNAKKITLEEAFTISRNQAFLALPEEHPSGLALYQKNTMARIVKLELTSKGRKEVKDILVADSNTKHYAWKSFVGRILGKFGLQLFLVSKKTPRQVREEQSRDIKRKAKKQEP